MNEFLNALRTSSLAEQAKSKLWDHWELVKRWNPRINLTAIQTDSGAASVHYLDSLAAATRLSGTVLDVGSGAGYPGIPLAVARPELQFVLLEPRRKRVSFLRTVVAQLSLPNVKVVMGRSTDTPTEYFDQIVTRATFSSTEDLLDCFAWLSPSGQLIAYRAHDAEIPADPVPEVVDYQLPSGFRALHIWTATQA